MMMASEDQSLISLRGFITAVVRRLLREQSSPRKVWRDYKKLVQRVDLDY
jgi:hypothetical protein